MKYRVSYIDATTQELKESGLFQFLHEVRVFIDQIEVLGAKDIQIWVGFKSIEDVHAFIRP